MTNVYFDNAATTRMHPRVLEKMIPYLNGEYGNPSSIHKYGRNVRVALEDARETIAKFINADPGEIYFVSNGTEANNFPVFGIAETVYKEEGKNHILTSSAEHPCIIESFEELEKRGFAADFAEVDQNGTVVENKLVNSVTDNTTLVSLIHINNETGSVNNICKLSGMIKKDQRYFHTDAVQSFGKVKIDVKELGIDSLSASAHKIHGPKGAAFVYVKSGTPLSPMIFGGSQERNRRGGTEFAAGIIGMAEAVKIAEVEMENNYNHVDELRKYYMRSLDEKSLEGISINCRDDASPYVLSLTFDSSIYNNDAEAMLMFLDINGIAASNGAACTSGTLKPSHVIMSMGRSKDDASGTIRFSFSYLNTKDEIDYVVDKLGEMAGKFRKNS